MTKLFVTAATVLSILGATSAPAFANVIHASGNTGKPSIVYSNPGSKQGQTNRSSVGSTAKATHDGWRVVVA